MLFKHLKSGGIYEFIGLGVNEADLKTMIMYRPMRDDGIVQPPNPDDPLWIRPAMDFFALFEPYVFFGQALTAGEIEDDEPTQTMGGEIKARRQQ